MADTVIGTHDTPEIAKVLSCSSGENPDPVTCKGFEFTFWRALAGDGVSRIVQFGVWGLGLEV